MGTKSYAARFLFPCEDFPKYNPNSVVIPDGDDI